MLSPVSKEERDIKAVFGLPDLNPTHHFHLLLCFLANVFSQAIQRQLQLMQSFTCEKNLAALLNVAEK